MHESTVADDRNGILFSCLSHGLVETVKTGTACTHAHVKVHGIQRSNGTKSITSYVAVYVAFVLLEGVENAAMWTARTHDRRSRRNFHSTLCRK